MFCGQQWHSAWQKWQNIRVVWGQSQRCYRTLCVFGLAHMSSEGSATISLDGGLAKLQARLVGASVDLTSANGRSLIKSGICKRRAKLKWVQRHVFLTNDLFLFANPPKRPASLDRENKQDQKQHRQASTNEEYAYTGPLLLKQIIDLKSVTIDPRSLKKKNLLLNTPSRNFSLQFPSEKLASQWCDAIASTAQTCRSSSGAVPRGSSVHALMVGTLHSAVANGDYEETRRLLKRLMAHKDAMNEINKADNQGNTALHEACSIGRPDLARLLLSFRADPAMSNARGETGLDIAARVGMIGILRSLLENADVVRRFSPKALTQSLTLTVLAAPPDTPIQGVVAQLVVSKASVDARDAKEHMTLLQRAAVADRDRGVEALLCAGAFIEDQDDRTGKTALHLAAAHGAEQALTVLLQHGAGANTRDHERRTPLHYATNIEVAVRLVEHAGRPEAKDSSGKKAKEHLLEKGGCGGPGADIRIQDARRLFLSRHALTCDTAGIPESDWQADKSSGQCALCAAVFTAVFRRHHCRYCGCLVCGLCSTRRYSSAVSKKQSRICDSCYIQLVYKQEVDQRVQKEMDRARGEYLPPSLQKQNSMQRQLGQDSDADKENLPTASSESTSEQAIEAGSDDDDDDAEDDEEDASSVPKSTSPTIVPVVLRNKSPEDLEQAIDSNSKQAHSKTNIFSQAARLAAQRQEKLKTLDDHLREMDNTALEMQSNAQKLLEKEKKAAEKRRWL
eukprot:g52369.t1